MKKEELKERTVNFIYTLIDGWFPNGGIQDNLVNSALKTIVRAKRDSFDNMLELFTDENGDVLVDMFVSNLADDLIGDGYQLDAREIASRFIDRKYLGFIPNKILLVGKDDVDNLKKALRIK